MTATKTSVGDDPMEQGMSYVEKLDYREQQQRFDLERQAQAAAAARALQADKDDAENTRAKYRLRQARQQTYQIIGVAFFILVLLLAIIAWIYFSTAGDPNPDTGPGAEERREQACVADGGGWVPADLLYETDRGLCVYPGHSAG